MIFSHSDSDVLPPSPGGTPRRSQSVSNIGERLNTRHMLAYRRTFHNEDQDREMLKTMPGSIVVAFQKNTLSLLVGSPLLHTAAAPALSFTVFSPTGALQPSRYSGHCVAG